MNGISEIKSAMEKKNSMLSKGTTPGSGEGVDTTALKGIIASPNEKATPSSVAGEADTLAKEVIQLKMAVHAHQMFLERMLPKLDQLLGEHEQIMNALNQAQTPAATQPGQAVQNG